MQITLKQHRNSRHAVTLTIKDNTLAPPCPDHIARYDKPIKSQSYMHNLIATI